MCESDLLLTISPGSIYRAAFKLALQKTQRHYPEKEFMPTNNSLKKQVILGGVGPSITACLLAHSNMPKRKYISVIGRS